MREKRTTMRNFNGKVVVVTGAAGGLGRALCLRFGASGAALGLMDVNESELSRVVMDLRGRGIDCIGVGCDITDEAACRSAIDRIANTYGRIDVLVNNAGITHRSAFVDTDVAVYRRVMDVNFFGSLHCTKAAVGRLIASRGLIVTVSSIAGFSPLLGRTGYSAGKHALHGLFDSLRAELRDTGVGVLIVCPGFTDTNIYRSALDGDGTVTRHPQSTMGKIATPEAVADAIYRAARRNERLLVLSTVGRLTRIVNKISPALYERLMVRALRSELQR